MPPLPRPAIIRKSAAELRPPAEPTDYDAQRARFSWAAARRESAGLPGGGLNIAFEAVERHARSARRHQVALRCIGRDGSLRLYTYAELARLTSRFANVLCSLGVGRGDVIFTLAERIAEVHIAVLGALKIGAVACPLFAAFGPEPIATRIRLGQGKVLVTSEALYRRKLEGLRPRLPTLGHVLVLAEGREALDLPGVLDLRLLMDAAADTFDIVPTGADDTALLHFTSGTTGVPKGVLHVHGAVVAHRASARFALDLRADDIFWCTADPGWVTGTSYGIIAPLALGATSVVDEGDFDAERWYRVLQLQGVSVLYTAPTAIRLLMRAGPELRRQFQFPRLRFVASVGEALNAEAVWWGREVLGLPIHDNWWQTETGAIMIANTAAQDIKPGSMGRPLPGVDACIVRRDGDAATVIDEPDVTGELALRRGWPSMFRAYLGEPARYRACFAGDFYLTGDRVRRDRDGYFWFVGRDDDLIKSAGHLIGPFEVESVLMEHPAVAEAGAIGKPDATVGEVVTAFIALNSGFEPSPALCMELLGYARKRLGAAIAPKEIEFAADLPHTPSGKILRRVLKARAMGLADADPWATAAST